MTNKENCVACGQGGLIKVLELGLQSPVNSLTSSPVELPLYELSLNCCLNCGHGQQQNMLLPENLFENYSYASSTSNSLKNYSNQFAKLLRDVFPREASVLEIACNDGILLRELTANGFNSVGIDPADEMVERAINEGLNAVIGFWPQENQKIPKTKFDLVVGQNVLAHNPHPIAFLEATHEFLEEDGVVIFQTSQADMVSRNEFDTIYHEHFSFFCEDSAYALSQKAGFKNLTTFYTPIHGTSAVFCFTNSDLGLNRAKKLKRTFSEFFPDSNSLQSNNYRKTRELSDWIQFAKNADQVLVDIQNQISQARAANFRVVCVGASAKGMTTIKAANTIVDDFIDEAQDKIGKYIPGLGTQIKNFKEYTFSGKDFYVFTAWNFAREIAVKMLEQGANSNSQVLIFFPYVHLKKLNELVE